jgi:hypothetical protein
MNRTYLAVPALLWALNGCAGAAFIGQGVPNGFVYSDATSPRHATDKPLGDKKGEACATSILGFVTTGNATIRAAADAGGIKDISAVDTSIRNILGIVARYCTIVSGTG